MSLYYICDHEQCDNVLPVDLNAVKYGAEYAQVWVRVSHPDWDSIKSFCSNDCAATAIRGEKS